MRKRDEVLKRSRELVHRRRRLRYLVLAVLCVLLCVGFFVVVHLDALTLKSVDVRGVEHVSGEEIEGVVLEELEGSYAFMVPRAHLFFYPKSRIEERVRALSPHIQSVRVRARSTTRLVVTVREREESFVWCALGREGDLEQSCFYTDAEGYAFSSTVGTGGLSYLTIVSTLPGEGPTLGARPLLPLEFVTLTSFIRSLPAEAYQVWIRAGGRREIYMREGYFIIVNASTDLKSALSNVRTALLSEEIVGARSRGEELEYLDVRVREKVFYRFKSGYTGEDD